MHGNLPAQAQRSIFPADSLDIGKFVGDSSVNRTKKAWFARIAERLWPSKTAAALGFLTQRHDRQCYRYAAGDQEPPGGFVVDLLRSPDGGRFLDEAMRGSDAEWYRRYQFALAALPAVEHLRQLRLPID